jgi:hypothetical protein
MPRIGIEIEDSMANNDQPGKKKKTVILFTDDQIEKTRAALRQGYANGAEGRLRHRYISSKPSTK